MGMERRPLAGPQPRVQDPNMVILQNYVVMVWSRCHCIQRVGVFRH